MAKMKKCLVCDAEFELRWHHWKIVCSRKCRTIRNARNQQEARRLWRKAQEEKEGGTK